MHSVHYTIKPENPAAHIFEVSCSVKQPDQRGQMLSLPAWIPGSYMIRDFARHIVSMEASCKGKPVVLLKMGKDCWRAAPCEGELLIRYTVYAWDLSVRAAHLDTTHGFFNGTSVFLRVHGQEQLPCSVDILRPPGAAGKSWRVATAMTRKKAKAYEFGLYEAADYDELIDHPVEMGEFTLAEFEAAGAIHAVAITGRHRCDTDRLCNDLKKLCEHHIDFFGKPAPVQRYVFLIMVVGNGYGGLEHRASCSLICSRDTLPLQGQTEITDQYREFLGLCSHEYFHTWNIKRIKPAAFTPYDLRRENYTKLLWAFEGITSYYDDLSLVRSGLIKPESYLELLGQNITRVLRGSGRFKQTVSDSSYYAWTKFYQQDENAPNAIVSYYSKGALVALCLDILLQQKSDGKHSLDDLMRQLWARYGQTGEGVPEPAIEALAGELAGEDLTPFFDQALRGTEDLPLEETFAALGISFGLRVAQSQNDKGGKPADADKQRTAIDFGAKCVESGGFPKLQLVYENGAAQRAGLSAGDVIIAVDGIKVGMKKFDDIIAQYSAETDVEVYAFRRDELMRFQVRLQAAEARVCFLQTDDAADEQQVTRRNTWLALQTTT